MQVTSVSISCHMTVTPEEPVHKRCTQEVTVHIHPIITTGHLSISLVPTPLLVAISNDLRSGLGTEPTFLAL